MVQRYWDLTSYEMAAVDKERTIVLIPLGAVEQHGPQAPLGTDAMIAEAMPGYIQEALSEAGADVPLLFFPAVPVGLSTEHLSFPGTVSLKPETYYRMLYEIVESIQGHGFRRFVFLLCHGGNRPVAELLSRQLRHDLSVYVFVLSSGAFFHPEVQATISKDNYWDFHGGEMETSMVMALHPEAVKLQYAETGYKRGGYTGKKVVNFSGDAALPWMGEELCTVEGKPIGIGGDPRGASPEKGEIILRRSARELVPALLEIRDWELS